MKITCDLCGGTLQVLPGGNGAACTTCGLQYSMDHLREKLGIQAPAPAPAPKPVPVPAPKPAPVPKPMPAPKQFILDLRSGYGDLCGNIRQGAVGLGDQIYINNDYSNPYTVCSINDDCYSICAKEGTYVELYLTPCPPKHLKNARTATGVPNPVPNAYNFPGTVSQYFESLLAREFSQFTVRPLVNWHGLSIPVNYMLYRNQKPVMAVFLIDSNNSRARYQIEKSASIFAAQGIACTHFFENYRNDESYVINRIWSSMG